MIVFLTRRLFVLALSLVVTTILIFLMLSVVPGNAAEVILGTEASKSAVAQLEAQLGITGPLWQQYLAWIGSLLHGDLGVSVVSSVPIGPQIRTALSVTVPLVLSSMCIAAISGVVVGAFCALRQERVSGMVLSVLSLVGISVPAFVSAIVLILIFSTKFHVLPSGGSASWSSDPVLAVKSEVLPALSLGLVEGSMLSRYVRSALVEVLREDFMRTARAKGLKPVRALRRHGIRNASLPIVTVLGLHFAGLVVGAVVVENVFALPGLGTLLITALHNRELRVVEDIVTMAVAVVLAVNFFVDVLYGWLDPRARAW